MAANLLFVLYQCASTATSSSHAPVSHRVLTLHNERPIILPACVCFFFLKEHAYAHTHLSRIVCSLYATNEPLYYPHVCFIFCFIFFEEAYAHAHTTVSHLMITLHKLFDILPEFF